MTPEDRDGPEGGDSVCWLDRVCDSCGGLADGPPGPVCARCGVPGWSAGCAPLFTVGHGTLSQDELVALLGVAGVDALVDIRRFPGSRAHPHVGADAMAQWLPAVGVAYRWEPRLGGRRSLPKGVSSPDTWWTVEAFRAYAAYTRTREFLAGLDDMLLQAADQKVVVMCSETLWWRCHRRLVADVAVLGRGRPVMHLLPAGPRVHLPAAGARLLHDGSLVWDLPSA